MVERIVLENGLTVLIEETPHSGVAALQCGFKVGSIYENADEGGICHLIEHMLFKGTENRKKAGEIAYEAESLGADINAFTSFENTVYHLTLSSRYFEEGLDILADMAVRPLFDPVELEREKEVVCEEIRRGEDSPSHVLSETLFKTCYRRHPYRLPIIGTHKSVKSFSAPKLHSFYRKWYGAKNAVVVVVSPIPIATVLRTVKKLFGTWQGGDPVHPELPQETGKARTELIWKKKKIEGIYFDLGWSIPRFGDPDTPALDLLSHILGGGNASRLETELKNKKHVVQSIYSHSYTPKDPGLLIVGGSALKKDVKRAIQGVIGEIRKLKKNGVSEDELARALLNLESERSYEKETADGIARKLMFFECTTGDFASEARYYDALAKVSAADLKRVAETYLSEDRLRAVVLGKETDFFSLDALSLSKDKAPSVRVIKRRPQKTAKDLSLHRLANGVRVLLRPVRHLPIFSIYAGVPGGLLYETKAVNGSSRLIARLLTKGTRGRSEEDIAIASEGIAGDIEGFSGRHALGLHAHMLASKKSQGLELFFDVLKNPSFSPDKVERERFLTLEAIRQQEDAPASFLWKNFLKSLFQNHPYGMPSLGDRKAVEKLTAKGLKDAYFKGLASDRLILSVVGDFDEDWALAEIDRELSSIPRASHKIALPARSPKPSAIRETHIPLEREQSHIALGFQGPTLHSKDRYALAVLNNVLAGQGGRLFLELRDRQSLAYSVTATLMEGLEPGFFALYIGCDPKKVEEAITGMKVELLKILDKPVSKEELARAKHQIVSGYEIELQRYGNMAHQMFSNELYGLPLSMYHDLPQHFEKVTAQEVLEVARKTIDLKAYTLCVLGP